MELKDAEHRKQLIGEAWWLIYTNPDYTGLGTESFSYICNCIAKGRQIIGFGLMYNWLKKNHPNIHSNFEALGETNSNE